MAWFLLGVALVVVSCTNAGETGDTSDTADTGVDQPPPVPENLVASAGDGLVVLTWDDVPGATSHALYWSTSPGVTKESARIGDVTSPFGHTGLTNQTTYHYAVAALNEFGESDLSEEVSATPTAVPPPAPTNVRVSPGASQIAVSWDPVATADSYNLYWSASTGFQPSAGNLVENASSPEVVGSLTPGVAVYFLVTAVNDGLEGAASDEVSGRPLPAVPANVEAAASDGEVGLSWDAVPDADSYNVYWSATAGVDIGTAAVAPTASTSWTHTPLPNGATTYYVVTALAGAAEGEPSAEVGATPAYPVQTVQGAPSEAIPDGGWAEDPCGDTGAAVDTLVVSSEATIADLDVRVNITHTKANDLYIYLRYDNGEDPPTCLALSRRNDGANDNYRDTWFDDDATVSVLDGWAPFAGRYRPEERLSAFDGMAAAGTWSLYVYDYGFGDQGTLDDWELSFVTARLPAPEFGVPQPGDEEVTLSWSEVAGATAYDVYWSTTAGVTPANGTAETGVTSPWTHQGLTNGVAHYYTVVATDGDGHLGYPSNEVKLIPDTVLHFESVPERTGTTGVGGSVPCLPDQIADTIEVVNPGTIADVDVWVDATMPHLDWLDLYLYFDNGVDDPLCIELSTDNGSGSGAYDHTRFDDEAVTPITSGSSPFAGTYIPEGVLADLDGIALAGTWGIASFNVPVGGDLWAWGIDITP